MFEPVAIENTDVSPFLNNLEKRLVGMTGDQENDGGYTSACPWQLSEGMLPTF